VFNCLEEDQRSTQQHCIEKYENFNKRYLNVDQICRKKKLNTDLKNLHQRSLTKLQGKKKDVQLGKKGKKKKKKKW
jgi:hypothetical protein